MSQDRQIGVDKLTDMIERDSEFDLHGVTYRPYEGEARKAASRIVDLFREHLEDPLAYPLSHLGEEVVSEVHIEIIGGVVTGIKLERPEEDEVHEAYLKGIEEGKRIAGGQ